MSVKRKSAWQNALLLRFFLYFVMITVNFSDAMMSSSCPEFCKCDVSRKYITCSEFKQICLLLPFPNDTRQLEIEWQHWPLLNASMFSNLIHLRKLQIASSAIKRINGDFTKLQKLKRLDLRNNEFNDSVFNTIGQMKQLKELILDSNLLRLSENNSFNNLEHVELLSLSWNRIEVVPSLRGLEEVQKLYLSNNFIRTVNRSTFGNLQKLEELYLQGNIITHIESGWANNLRFLRHLDLSENILGVQISRNVVGIEMTTRLETLILSNNSLLHVPCLDLSRTKHLIELNLSYNFINNLENDCLSRLKFLQVLDLKSNKIKNIEDFALQDIPMLQELFLDENSIHSLPPYWLRDSSVRHINLSFNNLLFISNHSFNGLEYLVTLLISGNRISSIAPTAFCGTNIVALVLDFNELQSLNSSQFECAVTLTVLSLGNNFITDIHPAAFKGIYLRELYLHSNSLETITDNLVIHYDLEILTLADNPWVCDCRLRWMREYLETGNSTNIQRVLDADVICFAPNPVVGDKLSYFFNKNSMVCSSFPSPLTIKLILATSISIIGFVVSVNICKLYCRFVELQKYGGDKEEKTHAL